MEIAPKALETSEVQYNEYKYAVLARKGIISISTCTHFILLHTN